MPYYQSYVPKAERYKKQIVYDLWTRPTLHYDPSCSKPIADAIDLLQELADGRYDTNANWLKAVWICAINFMSALFIWLVISMSFRCCKRDCKKQGCCHNYHCFYGNMVSYAIAEVLFAINFLWITGVTMGKF